MSQLIKVKVRAEQPIQFPNICGHCGQPANGQMEVRKRIGRVTRLVDVPLCADCLQEVARQSGDEERLTKISWLAMGLAFILVMAITLLLLPAEMGWLRWGASVLTGATAVALTRQLFRKPIFKAARPEKQTILHSVTIANFSWRATTFEFMNETFAERFRTLNESMLMDI